MTPDRARLERLLGGERLASLRSRLRKRFAADAVPPDRFTLANLSPPERDALAGLVGRERGRKTSLRLSHAVLDSALHEAGLAADLRDALEYLDGPIVDRAAREALEREWARLFEEGCSALGEALADRRTQGLVKRLAGGDIATARQLLAQCAKVLVRLPEQGIARARLAADVLGDAHALDGGRPIASLLRRVLDPPREHERWRDLWAEQGVLVNELAKPVVTLNLPVGGDDASDRLITSAAAVGEPLHLSLRLLARQAPRWREGRTIHVCENPEIVAAAADAFGSRCPPMVSLDGQLSAAPRMLLDQLAEAQAEFRYHGDFDWPGIAIANGIMRRYAAWPWCYGVADYRPGEGAALQGNPVDACWDPALTARMRLAGIAVHEEACLDRLLADLDSQYSVSS